MAEPQIQVLDHLNREVENIAEDHETRFAEVVGPDVKEVGKRFPAARNHPYKWTLPKGQRMGEPLIPERDWDLAGNRE